MKSQRQYQHTSDYTSDFKKQKENFVFRILLIFLFVIIMLTILTARLFYLQIIQNEDYIKKATYNRLSLIPTPPIRGEIIDTNGIILARNYSAFSLEIIPTLLEKSLEETIDDLKKYIDITEIDLKNYQRFRYQYKKFEKIPLKLKLSTEEASRFAPQLYRFPGVEINARTFREYPYGKLTAHILGYIGRINQKELDAIQEHNQTALYKGTTHIGKLGLEKYYELQLHGQPGFQEIEKDAQGNVVRTLRIVPPKIGQTLQLALDIRIQQKADELMGNKRGAIVAINPQSGEVIAMVSKPSFDNNQFVDGIDTETWNALNTDWQRPMINRALQGLYPPGSTFKPFMGIIALHNHSISMDTILPAPGAWSLPNSSHLFRDASRRGHGAINLSKAIQVSSDTFFYRLGYEMGIDTIAQNLTDFNFGSKTNIDLPNEYIGVLPSKEWKEKRFSKYKANVRQWIPADTVSVSIGQGYNAYTPLQMAHATAILANNGIIYRPHLVKHLIHQENETMILMEPHPIKTLDYKPIYFDYIKNAMHKVLQAGGTAARIGHGLKYSMAGKTGTAQVVQIKQGARYNAGALAEQHRDHAWFISFAPVEKPQIAIAVIIENGGWGANAAPIARQLTDYYFSLQHEKNNDQDSDNQT